MKLTDEMRTAISGELMGYEPDQLDIGIFLAGYRMGQQAMRERAAKVCADEQAAETDLAYNVTCGHCADSVRALPIEE